MPPGPMTASQTRPTPAAAKRPGSFQRTPHFVSRSPRRAAVRVALVYAIFTLDADGNVMPWNRGAQQITQWRDDDIIGQPYEVFSSLDDVRAGKPAEELERARTTGYSEIESPRVRHDGTEFWANVHLT